MKRAILALGVAVLLSPRAAFPAPRSNQNSAGQLLIDRAIGVSNIEAPTGLAYRLHAQFRIPYAAGKSLHGQVLRIWTPGGWLHEEWQMPGYQSVQVSDGEQVWSAENPDYVPYPIFLLRRALDLSSLLDSARSKELKLSSRPGASANTCVDALDRGHTLEYCFDPANGNLVQMADGFWNVTFDYSDYETFGGKRFPRVIRISQESGAPLADIRIDRLVPDPEPAFNVFLPVKGSKEWPAVARCSAIVKPSLEKMVKPQFPKEAEQAGITGIVRLYAEIGADGIPRGIWPINSVPKVLSQAAIDAVRSWRYHAQTCQPTGQPMPAVQQITAIFTSD